MNRLTHERVNGIKTGYWSAAKKDELVQRLAEYENTGLEPEEIMDGKLLTGLVPVEECLPQTGDGEYYPTLIMTLDDGKVVAGCYRTRDNEWWGDITDGEYSELTEKVVAWMPLPEPYSRGSDPSAG